MAENELNIAIRTEAKGDGADKTADSFRKMFVQAKAVNPQLKAISEQMAKELAPKLGAVAEKTDQATASKVRLKDAARGLAFQFPLLGRALALLTNPITAVIGLAVSAVAAFKKWSASIDEAEQRVQSLARFKQGLDGVKATTQEANEAMSRYIKTIDESGVSIDQINDKLEKQAAVTAKVLALRNEIAALEGRIAEAEGKRPGAGGGPERQAWNDQYSALLQASNAFAEQQRNAEAGLPGAIESRQARGRVAATASERVKEAETELSEAQKQVAEVEATGLGGQFWKPGMVTPKAAKARLAAAIKNLDAMRALAIAADADYKRAEEDERNLVTGAEAGAKGVLQTGKQMETMQATAEAAAPYEARIKQLRTITEPGPAFSTEEDRQRLIQGDQRMREQGRARELGRRYALAQEFGSWIELERDLLEVCRQLHAEFSKQRREVDRLKSQGENSRP